MSRAAQRGAPARARFTMRLSALARRLAPAGLGCALLACGSGGEPSPRPPNLILVTIDTLRADHTQAFGYARPTTPNLARLGEEGVRFTNTISQAPWTLPSMASLHTGLYPRQHGAVGGELALPQAAETLAERLQARGYHTVAVVTHEFVGSRHGFAQGFDVFDETNLQGHEGVTSAALTKTALERVAGVNEPFFLWVHYFDPHFTYIRHPEFGFSAGYTGRLPAKVSAKRLKETDSVSAADLAYVQALYDEEIALTDEWIGKLWVGLSARPGAGNDVLVVTADHGEAFQERGRFFHGKDVYQELVHVPLLIAGAIDPGLRGVQVTAAVETRSIPRTLLSLAGGEGELFGGVDLLEVARGGRAPAVFSEGSHAFGEDARKVAVVLDGWKLIHHLDQERYELYALASDPGERDDRWPGRDDAEAPAPLQALERCLAEFAALPCLEPAPIGLDAKALEELEDLGYTR